MRKSLYIIAGLVAVVLATSCQVPPGVEWPPPEKPICSVSQAAVESFTPVFDVDGSIFYEAKVKNTATEGCNVFAAAVAYDATTNQRVSYIGGIDSVEPGTTDTYGLSLPSTGVFNAYVVFGKGEPLAAITSREYFRTGGMQLAFAQITLNPEPNWYVTPKTTSVKVLSAFSSCTDVSVAVIGHNAGDKFQLTGKGGSFQKEFGAGPEIITTTWSKLRQTTATLREFDIRRIYDASRPADTDIHFAVDIDFNAVGVC